MEGLLIFQDSAAVDEPLSIRIIPHIDLDPPLEFAYAYVSKYVVSKSALRCLNTDIDGGHLLFFPGGTEEPFPREVGSLIGSSYLQFADFSKTAVAFSSQA